MALRPLETIAVFLPAVLIVGAVIWSVNNFRLENQAKNAAAQGAGFVEAPEMASATAAGIAAEVLEGAADIVGTLYFREEPNSSYTAFPVSSESHR